MRKVFSVAAGMAVFVGASQAQVAFSGGTYTQDFNTLATAGTNIAWTDNSTITGWYMRRIDDINGELADQYNAGSGTSTTGAVYSFGTGTDVDRALGSIASGSVEHIVYGLRLQNTSANNILSFTLNYTGEQWRNGGNTTAHALWFSYNVGGSTIGADTQPSGGEAGYVADPNFTRVASLDFTGPIATSTASALDGNAAANRVAVGGTVTLSTPWAPGADLWIRWVDVNNVGNDHGLGVDDLSFEAQPVPEPATLAALAVGAAALIRRRRK